MEAARPDLFEYIEVFDNRQGRHSSNGPMSPVEEPSALSVSDVAAHRDP